ncbi:MAG: hypothetical protein ACTHJW_10755 [Streptosporangiaceae bacterium]
MSSDTDGRRPAAAARRGDRKKPDNSSRARSDGRAPVQLRAGRERGQSESGQDGGSLRVRSEQGTRAAREGPGKQGRAPSDRPDVFLHVPDVHVGEIYLDVEDLDAHLSLQARLANLVQLVAGVHVHIGKVELDIKDVGAEALLKVRLENLYSILDRALTTVDRNPEILQGLLNTVDSAVDRVGETAQQAVQPGGAVSELAGDVGEVGKQAVGPGGAATEAVGAVGGTAQEAVSPGGAVSQATEGVTDTATQATQPGGAVSEATKAVGNVADEVGDSASEVAQTAGEDVRGTTQQAAAGAREVAERMSDRAARTPKKRGSREGKQSRPAKRGGSISKSREPDPSASRSDPPRSGRKTHRSRPEDARSEHRGTNGQR